MFSDQVISWVRTAVPIAVGVAVTWLATRLDIVIDPSTSAALGAVTTALVTVAYYTLIRRLEARWPQWGWLLGAAKTPVYANPGDAVRVNGVMRQSG